MALNYQKKKIAIFGATGSIGKNTVAIIADNLDKFEVTSLAAGSGFKTLAKQARILRPKYVVLEDKSKYQDLKNEISDLDEVEILCGRENIIEIAKIKCDIFVSAIMGFAGLEPTLAAIKAGSNVAIANKESIVCAGDFINLEAQKSKVKIYPIDSEHNAIFQIFENDNLDKIDSIILTASGGPFFRNDIDLAKVTVPMALKHPNWSMGSKISIDSATLMNKGLELIEAFYLFPISQDKINVLIHPQSIIHGIVNYVDGNSLSVMSVADMKIPISYCLSNTKRMQVNNAKLDLAKIKNLEFFEVDHKKYPALNLCKQALKDGNEALVKLNAANEIAVAKFLQEEIRFDEISKFVQSVLELNFSDKISDVKDVISFDKIVRKKLSNL